MKCFKITYNLHKLPYITLKKPEKGYSRPTITTKKTCFISLKTI